MNRSKGESSLLHALRDVHSGPATDISTHEAHPFLALSVGLDGKAVMTDLRTKSTAMSVDAAHSLQVRIWSYSGICGLVMVSDHCCDDRYLECCVGEEGVCGRAR